MTDEQALWDALLEGELPRLAGIRMDIPPKRVDYLCKKWGRRGIYDWGVACDLGWPVPTPDGWHERLIAAQFEEGQ